MDNITSRTNPTVRLLHSLARRRTVRRREGLFVAEGQRAIAGLLGDGYSPVIVLIDADRAAEIPQPLIEQLQAADARINLVEPSIFTYLSDVTSPQPLIAAFNMRDIELPGDLSQVVAIDGIQDPGNLGTILRTCRAAGVELAGLLPGTADLYNPKVVRATAGQLGSLAVVQTTGLDVLIDAQIARGIEPRIVIAEAGANTCHTSFDWTEPFVLVLGNEAAGPRSETVALATHRVRIDMAAGSESLNVGAAAAVLLFEARRQRQNG